MKLTKESWRRYLERARALDEAGGPAEDPVLFEEVIDLEARLLDGFDLPPTNENRELIWAASERTDGLSWLAGELALRPTRRTLAALPRVDRLTSDAASQRSPFDALPELGLETHEYIMFVYEQCCAGQIAPDVALRAMDAAHPRMEELALLRRQVLDLAAEGMVGLEQYLTTGDLAAPGPVYLQPDHVDLAYQWMSERDGGAPHCPACGSGTGWFDDTLLFEDERPWIKHVCADCERAELVDPGTVGLLDADGRLISAEDAAILREARDVK